MRIQNLIEDTPADNGCLHEHGLSFYVETPHHKLLVDAGATDKFKWDLILKEILGEQILYIKSGEQIIL